MNWLKCSFIYMFANEFQFYNCRPYLKHNKLQNKNNLWKIKNILLTPPHPKALAKSFPVPNGKTPTAGAGVMPIWSRIDKTHPTVPSPPHANIRSWGTLRNNSNLQAHSYRIEIDKILFLV